MRPCVNHLPSADVSGDQGIYFGAYSALQARAAGIVHVEGGMTGRLDGLELVRRIAERSKRMGASWATAIHPSHIPVINEVYSPSPDEIEEARHVVSAMAEAVARGDAAVRYKTGMVDYANVRSAMDVLKKAQEVGIDVGDIPKFVLPDGKLRETRVPLTNEPRLRYAFAADDHGTRSQGTFVQARAESRPIELRYWTEVAANRGLAMLVGIDQTPIGTPQ